jgi:predicted TPR repeat methyltransferase
MARPDADSLLRDGAAHHARGDLDGAEARYARVLALRPGDANALNLLGTLARQRGDLPRALALIGRAVALQPGAPVFLASLGGALAAAGRLPEAVQALRAALRQRPDDATSLRNLGQVLCALRQPAAALPPLRRAVALAPRQSEAHLALAHACREAGEIPAALAAARDALALSPEPELRDQAEFLLSALGEAPPPARAPAAYVRDLFDQYAPRFEADLAGRLAYRTPAELAVLLRDAGLAADGSRRVLDLGCGTGLSGLALAPFAERLEGLDLSPAMLAQAERHGVYAALHEADLLDFLPRHPGAFDLIAAADVLNYLGDLAPALAAMAAALAPGGIAAFSVELAEQDAPFALGQGLRFRHAAAPLLALCAAAGLHPLAERRCVLRQEQDQPVAGLLLVLRAG